MSELEVTTEETALEEPPVNTTPVAVPIHYYVDINDEGRPIGFYDSATHPPEVLSDKHPITYDQKRHLFENHKTVVYDPVKNVIGEYEQPLVLLLVEVRNSIRVRYLSERDLPVLFNKIFYDSGRIAHQNVSGAIELSEALGEETVEIYCRDNTPYEMLISEAKKLLLIMSLAMRDAYHYKQQAYAAVNKMNELNDRQGLIDFFYDPSAFKYRHPEEPT